MVKKKPMLPPIHNFSLKDNVSQLFGENAEFYKKHFDMPAHNGIDIVVRNDRHGYGTPIIASHSGTIEKICYDTPHHTKGNGIYMLDTSEEYSTIYWHLSGFQCNIGDKIEQGQVIGLMGNSGFVRPEPSNQDPYNGTHLHFAMKWHKELNPYQYYNYAGFCDPLPYINVWFNKNMPIQVCFPRNMQFGSSGNEVSWLQSIMKLEGFAQDYEPTGQFGAKTQRDVRLLQQKYEIYPALGFFYPKTRAFVTDKYTVY